MLVAVALCQLLGCFMFEYVRFGVLLVVVVVRAVVVVLVVELVTWLLSLFSAS